LQTSSDDMLSYYLEGLPTNKAGWRIIWLFLFSLAFLLWFQIPTPSNGDTYGYARSLSTFKGPLIHFGYYVLGHIFHTFLAQLGVNPVQTLAWVSMLFGCICIVCVYLFSWELTGDRFQSLLAAFILLFAGDFWLFSQQGEVYIPQLGFALFSMLSMLRRRAFVSSVCFLAAISITPTSLLVFPGLACIMWFKGFEKKQIAYFLVPIVLCSIALLLWDFSRIIGIFRGAIYSPKVFSERFSYVWLVRELAYRTVKVYGKSFNLLSFIAMFGSIVLYRQDRKIFFLMFMFLLPFSLYLLNLGLISGDHLIITFIVISFLASYGLAVLFKEMRVTARGKYLIACALVLVHVWVSYELFMNPEKRDSKELERVISRLAKEYKGNAIMISDYDFGMAFWYLTQDEQNTWLFCGRPNTYLVQEKRNKDKEYLRRLEKRFWINLPHLPGFFSLPESKEIVEGRMLYYVDRSDWPSWVVRLLSSDITLEKRKAEIPWLRRLQKYLEKGGGERIEFLKIIDSPLYPVYLLKRAGKET
jgi:hypothetical protein